MSKPLDAATRQEIERKRIKLEIDAALRRTAQLRAAVQEIVDHYEAARQPAKQ